MNPSIIDRMRRMYHVYQLTKYIHDGGMMPVLNLDESSYRNTFIQLFLSKHKFAKKKATSEAYEKALNEDYLHYVGNDFNGHTLEVTVSKGYKILDGWKYFPIGMWDEILKEFKTSTVFFIGLASSGAVIGLAKFVTDII